MRWEDRGTMSTPDPIGQLRSYFQLTDAILILRILSPLLNEHGKASLPFLESELASDPSAARLSISTFSSSRSGRSFASNAFGRSSSSLAFSETSSVHSGFTLENDGLPGSASQPLASSSSQRRHKQVTGHRVGKPTHKASAASSPILSPRKPSFECPFCWELKIPTSISRKADLKRHFKQFHQNNVQWVCQERGCSRAFDWKSAFEAHLKEHHGNSQHPSDTHQVKLCPQVVFACGFSNCRLVFEASCDDEAEKKATEYFNHVANHFDDNLTHRNWSFSVRIRNLMRQTAVEPHWKDRKKGTQDPQWQPHTSSVVRKILETRHFTDIPLLVQWVVNLGSFAFSQPHSPLPKLPAELRLPIKETCTLVTEGHGSLVRRDSHRHAPPEQAPTQNPGAVEVELAPPAPAPPPLEPEPEPEPEPGPGPEMEQELKPEPEVGFVPPPQQEQQQHAHELQQHPMHTVGMSLPPSTYDSEPSYTSFQHDTIMTHQFDGLPHQETPITSSMTPSFMNSQPIAQWLGMTETPPLPLQPELDTILGYPPSTHHNVFTSDFRSVTPSHQQILGHGHHGYGVSMMPPQQTTIAPVDLEMSDCTFETEVKHY